MSNTFTDPNDPETIARVSQYWTGVPSDELIQRRDRYKRALDHPNNDAERANAGMYELNIRCINSRIEDITANPEKATC